MKWLWNFVSVSLVLAASVLTGPTAKAGTDITSPYKCPIIIDHPGEYNLKTDVACSSTDGIDIEASDVTLHLDHHTIKGSSAASTCNASTGIFVRPKAGAPMLTDVRVLGDGTISNFRVGFWAQNSADSVVKFTTVTGICTNLAFSWGFVIQAPGSHWKLQGNVVREPGDTSTGIDLENIDDSHVVANDVNDTLFLSNSSHNVIVNNIADDNAGGIVLGGSTGSNNNEIHANTTNNNKNGNQGLWIAFRSTGNNVTGNYSFANLAFDMEDDNPCGSNKWRGNHFGTASPLLIGCTDDDRKDDDRNDDDRPGESGRDN